MDNNTQFFADETAWQTIRDQFETLLVYLGRPVVQDQIVALVVALLVAYLLFRIAKVVVYFVGVRIASGRSDAFREAVLERWVPAVDELLFPLIVIALVNPTNDRTSSFVTVGLLREVVVFFWVVLAYQFVLTIFYATFKAKNIRRYQHYVFNPLFVLVLGYLVLRNFFTLSVVGEIQVFTLLDNPVTLARLFWSLVVLYVFIALNWVLSDAITTLLPRIQQDTGVIQTVRTVTQYIVIGIGILVSLTTLGFNLTTLAAVAGGLSLGAGLGLRALVSNFSSGLVLLFEQSIRPGDMVEVSGQTGIVQRLNIRSTVVRTFANVDIIVPNENLLSSAVTTHATPDDVRKRASVEVVVAIDTEPQRVLDILIEVATQHEMVIDDPAPSAWFLGFSDQGMRFALFAWVAHLDDRFSTQCDLHSRVWYAFRDADLVLAYPPRRAVDVTMNQQPESRPSPLLTPTAQARPLAQPDATSQPNPEVLPDKPLVPPKPEDSEGDTSVVDREENQGDSGVGAAMVGTAVGAAYLAARRRDDPNLADDEGNDGGGESGGDGNNSGEEGR